MTIPAYKDIAEKFFGTLWQEAQPADWALVAWKLSEQRAEVAPPKELVDLLLASKRDHLECEDCWYSCSTLCCDDERSGNPCDCGADTWNALVDKTLSSYMNGER